MLSIILVVTTETVSKNYAQRKREENQNSSLQKPTRKAAVDGMSHRGGVRHTGGKGRKETLPHLR